MGPAMTEVGVLCIPLEITDGGGSKAICLRIFWDFSAPYGPLRAHLGPYGRIWARPGPLKSGKSSENRTFFT